MGVQHVFGAACLGAALLSACATAPAPAPIAPLPQAADATFQAGAAEARQHDPGLPARPAKNLILFVGDGLGVTTVTAARILAGQEAGHDGPSHRLAMDDFPHTALSRTYSHDFLVTDSAASATSLTAGVKNRSGVINLTADVALGDCAAAQGRETRTLFEIAEQVGLATGVVSTARLTHATPAAVYAHSPHRNWENDAAAAEGGGAACPDIARQLIEWPVGDGLEIALGGGRANFLPKAAGGRREDGRDLIAEWAAKSPAHRTVANAGELAAADVSGGARVLGLFSPSHMSYEQDRKTGPEGEPSLEEMTRAALARLQGAEQGYVLMVEGGRIDHAHHEGKANKALHEAIAFDAAIKAALELTDREDTLVLVTADHSHVMSFAGYAKRDVSILGLAGVARDGKPYTTLSYANGPGGVFPAAPEDGPAPAVTRPDLTGVDTLDKEFRQPALTPLSSETHGGEDVAVYAWGPGQEMVRGTMDQHVIFHIAARALGFTGR